MATWLLVLHHAQPDLADRSCAASSSRHCRISFDNPGAKRSRISALAVASIGIESVADHEAAVTHDIGDDRDQTESHLAEIDVGIANG